MASGTSLSDDGVNVKQVQELKLQGEGVYTGQVHADTLVPHGCGRMEYFVLDTESSAEQDQNPREFDDDLQSYEGNWHWGAWHGPTGILQFTNGDSYVGEFFQNQRHGQGLYMWNDGRTYEGAFVHNLRHGHGVFTFGDGAVYTGEFYKGSRHGHGRYAFANGNYYNGGWKDGKYDGYGVFKWNDGREYKGEWKESQCHGRGIETDAFGDIVHDGMWSNHKPVIRDSLTIASAEDAPSLPLEISVPNPGPSNEHTVTRHDNSNQRHGSSSSGRWREPSGRAAVSMHNLNCNQDLTITQPPPNNRMSMSSANSQFSDTSTLGEFSAYQPENSTCDQNRGIINGGHRQILPSGTPSPRWRDPRGVASQSMHNLCGNYTSNSQQRQQQQEQQQHHHRLLQQHQQQNQHRRVLPSRPIPRTSETTQGYRSSGGSSALQSSASLIRSSSENAFQHQRPRPAHQSPSHRNSDFSHVALLRSTSARDVNSQAMEQSLSRRNSDFSHVGLLRPTNIRDANLRNSLERGSSIQSERYLANSPAPQNGSPSHQGNRRLQHNDQFISTQQQVESSMGSNIGPARRSLQDHTPSYSSNEQFRLARAPNNQPSRNSAPEQSALPAGWEGLPEISALIEGQRQALERYNSLRDLNKDNGQVGAS